MTPFPRKPARPIPPTPFVRKTRGIGFQDRLTQARSRLAARHVRMGEPYPVVTLFLSVSDGAERAQVVHASGHSLESAWQKGIADLKAAMRRHGLAGRWLRIEQVDAVEATTWRDLRARLSRTKRNYFRSGLSCDAGFEHAFLEQELNANAMLYGGNIVEHAILNERNFAIYAARRFGETFEPRFTDNEEVFVFSTRGVFCDENGAMFDLDSGTGFRQTGPLGREDVRAMIASSSGFLARQVKDDGVFVYGYHPCFDRSIDAYNTLRHASTTYAMIEAWEVTRDDGLKAAIERSIARLTGELIRTARLADGIEVAFLVDVGDEVKLGGNAVAILALTRYCTATGSRTFLPLLEKLALGIGYMQNPKTGAFSHVLRYSDLSVKDSFRTIYYEGEAAFGLMRLYGLTRDERWLGMVEKAFEHFIRSDHWQHHDHWLSYCVNELTRYRPKEIYFRFGIRNVAGYLDFVLQRITTFPTLLELMMAAREMIERIGRQPDLRHLLEDIDLQKFQRALEFRAHYLLNGYFWPETAMYFRNPDRIVGSFFIRHHAFRVRIDDVEHYLSGFVAYLDSLDASDESYRPSQHDDADAPQPPGGCTLMPA